MHRIDVLSGTLAGLLYPLAAAAASSHVVQNNGPTPIVVVMDSNRETHAISSGSKAVFVLANPGDQPTFKVFVDGNDDGKPDDPERPTDSTKVSLGPCILVANCLLEWDGKSLKQTAALKQIGAPNYVEVLTVRPNILGGYSEHRPFQREVNCRLSGLGRERGST